MYSNVITGYVDEQAQNAFVKEVERVVMDPVYWVRRESSFVLGALAKVVPDEIVHSSLVSHENVYSDITLTILSSFLFWNVYSSTLLPLFATPRFSLFPSY